jgi:hypothetical protein
VVECDLAKVEVAGSNPVSRSIPLLFRLPAVPRPSTQRAFGTIPSHFLGRRHGRRAFVYASEKRGESPRYHSDGESGLPPPATEAIDRHRFYGYFQMKRWQFKPQTKRAGMEQGQGRAFPGNIPGGTVSPPPSRAWRLRELNESPDDPAPAREPAGETDTEEERLILCRQCGWAITNPKARITVDGAHRHTFANPHGLLFEIGCFHSADGCVIVGPATDDFTWFKGFFWRIAVCRQCGIHLGWRFETKGLRHFTGLILDRLTEWSASGTD